MIKRKEKKRGRDKYVIIIDKRLLFKKYNL